jgi:hypothetical protein
MITDFQSIVDEWSYRVGIIDLKDNKHLYHLNQILYEYGWTQDVIDEIYQNLTEDDIVKNKKSGNTYVVKTHNPDTQDLVKKDASPEDVKKVEKDDDEKDIGKRIINGKDKTIKKVDTSKSEAYIEDIEPSDEKYQNDYEIGEPPPEFKISEELDAGKFPKKYIKLIERMMNSKRVGTKPEISTLISTGGAGAISAQAGEVLTLMASSMSNEDWDKLQTAMLEHEKKTIESNPDLKVGL